MADSNRRAQAASRTVCLGVRRMGNAGEPRVQHTVGWDFSFIRIDPIVGSAPDGLVGVDCADRALTLRAAISADLWQISGFDGSATGISGVVLQNDQFLCGTAVLRRGAPPDWPYNGHARVSSGADLSKRIAESTETRNCPGPRSVGTSNRRQSSADAERWRFLAALLHGYGDWIGFAFCSHPGRID